MTAQPLILILVIFIGVVIKQSKIISYKHSK